MMGYGEVGWGSAIQEQEKKRRESAWTLIGSSG